MRTRKGHVLIGRQNVYLGKCLCTLVECNHIATGPDGLCGKCRDLCAPELARRRQHDQWHLVAAIVACGGAWTFAAIQVGRVLGW